jgi:hypothetical protein
MSLFFFVMKASNTAHKFGWAARDFVQELLNPKTKNDLRFNLTQFSAWLCVCIYEILGMPHNQHFKTVFHPYLETKTFIKIIHIKPVIDISLILDHESLPRRMTSLTVKKNAK